MMKLFDINIDQITTDKERYYEIANFNKKLKSVTTIINLVEPKEYLKTWSYKLAAEADKHNLLSEAERYKLGHDLAIKQRDMAGNRGTYNHKCIEDYLLSGIYDETKVNKEFLRILKFLNIIEPISIEEPVYYYGEFDKYGNESFDGQFLGYAGTVDSILKLNEELVDAEGMTIVNKDDVILCDWKFYQKTKTHKFYNPKTKQWCYPLIKVPLQLSAYYHAVKFLLTSYNITPSSFELSSFNKIMVVQAPVNARDISLYVWTERDIAFYFNHFIKILTAVASDEPFDWNEFCKEADYNDHLGTRIYLKEE